MNHNEYNENMTALEDFGRESLHNQKLVEQYLKNLTLGNSPGYYTDYWMDSNVVIQAETVELYLLYTYGRELYNWRMDEQTPESLHDWLLRNVREIDNPIMVPPGNEVMELWYCDECGDFFRGSEADVLAYIMDNYDGEDVAPELQLFQFYIVPRYQPPAQRRRRQAGGMQIFGSEPMTLGELRTLCNKRGLSCCDAQDNYLSREGLIAALTSDGR